ncbi:MAG: cyclase family protein [Deltaproteobacteria bacterium]|nr:cyclase family protein [Deltaproteobacteria bacterium]MBW2495651.1 cyclase family protein [Deltaproteobacteria bacterium]
MADRVVPSSERMNEIFESVKNWGRWGDEDEAGALNLITDEVRRGGAAAVRHGRAVSCGRDLPVEPDVDNPHPALHMMTQAGDDCLVEGFGFESTTDFVGLSFHGMASSHIDALCHVLVDGRMYNGFEAQEVKSTGARRNAISVANDGIVSRGVLLDLPRLRGVPWLELGTAILPEELEAAEEAQRVRVREGDILLFQTGREARRAERGNWNPIEEGLAGLHPECLPWLHERGVAVLGCDGISDPLPVLGIEGWTMPIHQTTLVAMGVHLLDNLKLDALAAACAELSQWDFQLNVGPLRIPGGTGSPANPIALL